MSSVPPGGWDPDDTGGVPVGPEPEPTGAGGAGSGGWGEAPRTEPFAIAALVWAIVSIVLPLVGTIVALVLAARAADSIRRSQGTRSGTNLVNAARITAGVVLALWAIGGIVWVATRDGSSSSDVTVPTQPTSSSTTTPPSTTTTLLITTTTSQPIVTTTTLVPPTTSIVPPPPTTAPPTTAPPTTLTPTTTLAPTTTQGPTTTTEAPTTTTEAPTTTTTPEQGEEERIVNKLLTTGSANQKIGPSNRGLPNDERVTVAYVEGETLVVTWAINDGTPPLPTGTSTCPATPSPPGSSTTTSEPSTSSTSSTTSTTSSTSTTSPPAGSTVQLARTEARRILNTIRSELNAGRLDIDGLQLIGTYPIEGADEGDFPVVQVFLTNDDVDQTWPSSKNPFDAPPATDVQCVDAPFG